MDAATLDVAPPFRAYGEPVIVKADANAWLPATRFRRDGATVVVEVEDFPGGFFGPRADVAPVELSLGELAPGRYTVQARLFDIANLEAPPRLLTQSFEVAAPDAPGVHTLPRSPGAQEPVQLIVRAEGPVDAASARATVSGNSIRIEFNFSTQAEAPSHATVKVGGLAPGTYHVEAFANYTTVNVPPRRYVADFNVGTPTTVVEYYAASLDHYVVSAWPDEVAQLDSGMAFKRTGLQFKAWLRGADAPPTAVPVCRFYASGANSHFYTADSSECQFLKSLEQKDRAAAMAKGDTFRGWQYEAVAFYALPPQSGSCAPGTTPVYRLYNNRASKGDSNHRFTASPAMLAAMTMQWVYEGVAFCSPA